MIDVNVRFWGTLKRPTPRLFQMKVPEPATVGVALKEVCRRIGGSEAEAVQAELLGTAALLVNGDTIGHRGGLSVPLSNGDTLSIVLAMSGG